MPSPRAEPGRVLAVDPGTVRIGLALSDPLRIVAQPLDVVPAGSAGLDAIARIVVDEGVTEIVVGLPINLNGTEGAAAAAARELAAELETRTGLPVHLVDERFTTRTAEQAMLEGGARRRTRRDRRDQVAAALILRHYLESSP